ncbi:hypothetical protein ElP_55020 [Tautonia plasticadhaerens]|uniref:Uncharacterized protein n=2 Tax=Tautonia plasticadhaerens TaxID=2527974 RepID=A0A518H9M1_9BACT|nr:hypothetical protein ElP_55020 [Tautonia plasticadhaerens]
MSAEEYRRQNGLASDADILPHLDEPYRRWIIAARRRTRALLGGGSLGQAAAVRIAVDETDDFELPSIRAQRRIAKLQAGCRMLIEYRDFEIKTINRRGIWFYEAESLGIRARILDDLLDMIDDELAWLEA